ncbi:MAG: ankyrin repeat domain-containing protein, partial [Rickettsiales bacterium]|nr:ankyrin repeat domain-containing protein [Rickettsiales bacterium]
MRKRHKPTSNPGDVHELVPLPEVLESDSGSVSSDDGDEFNGFSEWYRRVRDLIKAAENGRLNIVNRLIELTPVEERQEMIRAFDYEAFRRAAENGHLDVVNRLIELIPVEERQEMIRAFDYEAFRRAAENGHLDVVNRLIELIPVEERQ